MRRRKIALNKVKEARLKKRLTQYALARKVNRSHWWVSKVERGLSNLSEDEKIKIAKALETEVKEIFP